MMEMSEIRLRCLQIVYRPHETPDQAVERAKVLEKYVAQAGDPRGQKPLGLPLKPTTPAKSPGAG